MELKKKIYLGFILAKGFYLVYTWIRWECHYEHWTWIQLLGQRENIVKFVEAEERNERLAEEGSCNDTILKVIML